MLRKPIDAKITDDELNRGKMTTDKEMSEQERLAKMANDIMTNQATVSEARTNERESLLKRQERLRRQRDLLLAKKKAEREKELQDYAERGGIGA
jgi:hypothetical protein